MSQTLCHAVTVVEEFWRLMATNDFSLVRAVLADEFILDWPQSNERIRGKERFAAMKPNILQADRGASQFVASLAPRLFPWSSSR
jgi:hypothetical protein